MLIKVNNMRMFDSEPLYINPTSIDYIDGNCDFIDCSKISIKGEVFTIPNSSVKKLLKNMEVK